VINLIAKSPTRNIICLKKKQFVRKKDLNLFAIAQRLLSFLMNIFGCQACISNHEIRCKQLEKAAEHAKT